VHHAAGDHALVRTQLDHDRALLGRRLEEAEVDARREQAVVAGEPFRRGVPDALGEGEQRVEPRKEPFALRAGGRVAQPVDRAEGSDCERGRVAKCEVRERRQPRLEAVDDLEVALGEREREAGAHADRDPHLRAPRDRYRRPDGDHVRGAALQQRSPARPQFGGACRRREDGDRVTAFA
jgi:hypothetical protein